MNNKRRAQLGEAKELINKALAIASVVLDNEEDCMDNLPENLQSSEKYEKMEDAVSSLEELIEHLEDAIESANEAAE